MPAELSEALPHWLGGQQPGWFFNAEVGILKPHLVNNLVGSVNVGGLFTDTVALPSGWLDWTASPEVELGYRFGEGGSELLVAYRNVTSEGNDGIENYDPCGEGWLHSRLNLNVIDLDYATPHFNPRPNWDVQARLGGRIATASFSARAEGQILEQRLCNDFVGGGPQLALDVARAFPGTRLALFSRLEGAVLFGEVQQRFEETIWINDVPLASGASCQDGARTVPIFRVQAGLSWTPQWSNHSLRLSGGYEYEHWWNLGSVGSSSADLGIQGVFLRCEWTF
jgi:hypothetical protein